MVALLVMCLLLGIWLGDLIVSFALGVGYGCVDLRWLVCVSVLGWCLLMGFGVAFGWVFSLEGWFAGDAADDYGWVLGLRCWWLCCLCCFWFAFEFCCCGVLFWCGLVAVCWALCLVDLIAGIVLFWCCYIVVLCVIWLAVW